jgi:NADH-quinone oxidoreductase subunit M
MGAEDLGPTPWIYTAFATTGVILAAVYLLWMFQSVFMGPLDKEENKALRDVNRRELAIFIAFLVFIFWIGIGPSLYFGLMDTTVAGLLESLGGAVAAFN